MSKVFEYLTSSYKQVIRQLMCTLPIVWFAVFSFSASSKEMSAESQQLVDELKDHLQSTLLAISEIESNAGNSASEIYFSLDMPAQQLTNFGLVLDLEDAESGFSVLSVTLGSEADRAGIVAGDKLLKIDNLVIDSSSKEQAIDALQSINVGKTVRFQVKGESGTRDIETKIAGTYIPSIKLEIGSESEPAAEINEAVSDSTCGEVSVFFRPPETRKLYPAYVSSINGNGVLRVKKSFRLKPGKYQFKLHELIDDPFFTRRSRRMQKAKILELEIKPNMRYDLAARFISEKKLSLRDDFWEPVVWRSREQKCEL